MPGCGYTSITLVNAEVDSMGVIDDGHGVVNRTSPPTAAIDTIHADHRQECDGRDKRKRELEFLEKGGNPLDYELGNAAPVTVQTTSLVGHKPYKLVDSEPKCNFPETASPSGDSVESCRQPGEALREPIDQSSLQPSRSETVLPERSVPIEGNRSSRENGDSAAVGIPGKAYKRRNRSRQNRDGGRSTSNDPNPPHGNNDASVLAQLSSKDVKRFVTEGGRQNGSLDSDLKTTDPLDNTSCEMEGVRQESKVESTRSAKSNKDMIADASTGSAFEAFPKIHVNKFKQGSSLSVEAPSQFDSSGTDVKQGAEELTCVAVKCHPSDTSIEFDNQPSSSQMDGKHEDVATKDGHAGTSVIRGLDLESSTQTKTNDFGDSDVHMCTNKEVKNQKSKELHVSEIDKSVDKDKHYDGVDTSTFVEKELDYSHQRSPEKGFALGPEEKLKLSFSTSDSENKAVDHGFIKGSEASISTGSVSGRKSMDHVCDNPDLESQAVPPQQKDIIDPLSQGIVIAGSSTGVLPDLDNQQSCSASELKVTNKIDEDSILKEAQIIQAKRKRIAALSVPSPPTEILQRAHWDYVLEEIAWLANDFSQERIWKMAAACQISYRAACASCLNKKEFSSSMEVKKVAHKLARAVMEFWLSVDPKYEETEELEIHCKKNSALSVRAYAVRFVKYNSDNILQNHMEVPLTPDRISEYGNIDMSGDSDFAEEKLFYMVSPGVMQAYRKSIESHVGQSKDIGYIVPEEVETSACDTATAYESDDTVYDDDEGETSTYNISEAFEYNKPSRIAHLKRKKITHADGARSYDIGPNLAPMLIAENKFMSRQSALAFKRPGSNLSASIPTKRVRSASASRKVISPFNAVGSGSIQVPTKRDASSGDTNSYQDDQSTLHGALLFPNSLEVESTENFEKQLPLESAEVSKKSKKRKNPKHLYADYEGHRQDDSTFHNDQFERDHFKKRSDGHLESNSSTGFSGQPMKKLKIVHQSHDSSFKKMLPAGSLPSPAASQMSNMFIPNKFIKIFSGRDRMKKDKTLKSSHGQVGSGSPWSDFEDQALVVLVHDLGPNWELVSDALNSLSDFKCIFRKAKECKERHSALMDRTSGDGGESAEDSGNSQAYRATIPGIPKGTARQLFQRLQDSNDVATFISHFQKITMIMQKQNSRRAQDQNPISPHSSHDIALSQVFPNNLNGVPVLTPLDLCDVNTPGPEILPLGHQGPNPSGLAIASQVSNPAIQSSPNVLNCNNVSASPGRPNSSMSREMRYPAPRSASLSMEEQRRSMYNQMISDRNTLSPSVSSPRNPPGTQRNSVGIVTGANRSLPMVRPGLQGMSSPSMVNPGSSTSSLGMHSSTGPNGHGSLVLRPREPGHIMRSVGQEQQRQVAISEHQMPGSSSQGVPYFGGLSTLANQANHAHVQRPQNPGSNAQRQAYAIRLAKERQLQQHFRQQQQQQYAASNSLAPNAQPQPQQPKSSPMQNSSLVQPHTSSPLPPSPLNSIPQHSQKQIAPNQVVIRGNVPAGSSLGSQGGKQRQSQQQHLSPANRQHSQQRAQLQIQQQGKVAKVVGRGNVMHQSITTSNGVSTNSISEKGEPLTAIRPVSASPTSNQSMPQQKLYPGQGSSLPKNLKITSQSNNTAQAHIQPVLSSGHQPLPSSATPGSNQRSSIQNQAAIRRVAKPNNLVNSAPSTVSQSSDPNGNQQSSRTSSAVDPMKPLPQTPIRSAELSQKPIESNAVNSSNNLRSLASTPSNLGQQGPSQKPTLGSTTQSKPVQVTDPQKQAQLPQSGNGDLYGSLDDPLE